MSENWEWLIGKSLSLGKVIDVVEETATVRHGDDEFRITVSELLCKDYRSKVRQAMRPKAKQPLMVRIRELESVNADILATVDQFLRDEGYSDEEVGEFLCPLVIRLKEPPR